MVAKKEQVDIDFKSNLDHVQSQIDKVLSSVSKLDSMTDRLYNKGKNNNFTLTDRDNTNLRGQAGTVQKGTDELQQSLKDNMQRYNDIRVGKSSASNDDISRLEQTISALSSSLDKMYDRVGTNPMSGKMNPSGEFGEKFRETLNMKTRATKNFSTPYSESGQRDYQKFNSDIQGTIKDLRSTVSNLSHQYKRTDNRVNDTIQGGRVSYERFNQYKTTFRTGTNRVGETNDEVNSVKSRLQEQLASKQAQYADIDRREKSGEFSPNEKDGINAQKNVVNSEIDTLKKSIDKLNEFNKTLDKTQSTIDSSRSKLEHATTKDEDTGRQALNVDSARDSFLGRLKSRQNSIAGAVVSSATGGLSSGLNSGNNTRLSTQEENSSIMTAEANKNGVSKGMDNTILNRLQKAGMSNGAGYTGSQMSQFASTYTGSTGNTNYVTGANAIASLARFSGMGSSTAQGVISALGATGGANTGITNTSNTIAGEITNSGMSAKAQTQGQALSSMYSNISNRGLSLTKNQSQSIASLQGIMATEGSSMQGSEGAQGYSQLSNGIANGYNDPVTRALFGGNNSKYTGVEGSARLNEDMQNSVKKPWMLNNYIKNSVQSTGSKEVAASNMSQQFGISMEQAKHWINLQQNGKLTKSYIESENKKNAKKGSGNGKGAYSQSGNRSLNYKQAYEEQQDTAGSEAGDGLRNLGNMIAGGTHPLLRLAGSGLALGALSFGGHALANAGISGVKKAYGAVGGFSGVARSIKNDGVVGSLSKVKNAFKNKFTSGAKEATSSAEGATRTAKGAEEAASAAKDASNLGKTAEAVGDAGKFAKFGKFGVIAAGAAGALNIGKSAIKGATKVGSGAISRASGLFKGSKVAQKASKTGSSLLGKASGFFKSSKGATTTEDLVKSGAKTAGKFGGKLLPGVGIAASGISLSDHVNKHNYVGAAGDAISATGDALDLTGVGGVVGVPMSLAGAGISAVSDWFSGGKKKSSKKSTKSSSKKLHTKKSSEQDSDGNMEEESYTGKGTLSDLTEKNHGKKSKVKNSLASLLKGFNDMLDKAERVIADAKSIKSGDSDKSDSSDSSDDSDSSHTKGVEQWKSKIKDAAKAMGQKVSNSQVNTILKLIGNESGGDQAITGIDDGDGTGAAIGLMQYKQSTFDTYKLKGHTNIRNGYDQLLAFFNDSNWASDIGTGYNGKDGEWRGQASGPSGKASHKSVPHATGGIYNKATYRGDEDIVGEDGWEAAIPLNAKHRGAGEASLKSLAGMFGKEVITPGENTNNNSNLSQKINMSPSYTVHINAGNNADSKDIAKQVNEQIQASNNDFMEKLNGFFSKAVSNS
ncbi:tail protein [Lactobacillus phage LpeD]|uniref:Tail protein n=1 Tax=Lactobacillus phage LpeD TaxID=2041210 RepID=A0A291I9G4_9CAUD|nr:tail associated lysin [Lactobacillus phage LpeD]ATG86328.1 tail protein [Lactobacillus phage LpeD]